MKITDKALQQLTNLAWIQCPDEETIGKLKISIQGGGCSGLTYKMEWLETYPYEPHKVETYDKFDIIIDPKSYLFLKDVTLDFSDGLDGKGFEFVNPTAKRTCGCGSSFST